MKNVDIDMIVKGLPTFKYEPPKCEWDKYLSRDKKYDPNELVEVRTKKRIWDIETNIHHIRGSIIKLTKARASYMEALDYVEVL